MAQFNASFTKGITGTLLDTVLTLTDTSNYDASDPLVVKGDFYTRRFEVRDINSNLIQTLDLGATATVASFNVGGLLSLQPVYLEIRLVLLGYGGTYNTIVPYYLPTLIP